MAGSSKRAGKRKSRRMRIGRRLYTVLLARLSDKDDGLCDDPDARQPHIRIDRKLVKLVESAVDSRSRSRADRYLMEVVIHEITHAQDWELPEPIVMQRAREMARVLSVCGWRLEKSPDWFQ